MWEGGAGGSLLLLAFLSRRGLGVSLIIVLFGEGGSSGILENYYQSVYIVLKGLCSMCIIEGRFL